MPRQKLFTKAFIFICSICAVYFAVSYFLGASEAAGRKNRHRAALADSECSLIGFVYDYKERTEIESATMMARALNKGKQRLLTEYSEADGYYCFMDMNPGKYTLTVKKSGYNNNVKTIQYKGKPLSMNIYLKCKSSAGCVDTSGGTSGGGSSGGSTGGTTGGSKTTELSVTPKSRNVGYGATSTSFNVTNTGGGTLSWTATVSSGGDWLSISSGSSGTNDGTITVAFSANTTSKSRGGIIRVDASGVTSKYVTVTQEASAGGSTGGTSGGTTGGSTSGGSTSGGTTGGGSTSGGTSGGTTGGTTGGSTDTTAPTTNASPAGSSFTSAQSVTLSCSDTGGSGCSKTYYTTDGSVPTTASTVYSSAISISATTTLKFFSVDVKENVEPVKTETYTITTTSAVTTMTDIDGNVYNTVTIGTQTWMKENLKVTKYRDGTAIPTTTANISTETSPKYQWAYNGDENNVAAYGRLYTWPAATDSRGLCPSGWHLPTDAEWTTLENYLGGSSVAGGKMKEAGTTHWLSPNTGADNSSGFTARPGGYRTINGTFTSFGSNGYWWSATELYSTSAWYRDLGYSTGGVYRSFNGDKISGFSVRCVGD